MYILYQLYMASCYTPITDSAKRNMIIIMKLSYGATKGNNVKAFCEILMIWVYSLEYIAPLYYSLHDPIHNEHVGPYYFMSTKIVRNDSTSEYRCPHNAYIDGLGHYWSISIANTL